MFAAAEDAGLYIVLDPIHVTSEDDSPSWSIPTWAWSAAGLSAHRDNVVDVVDAVGIDYVAGLLERYCDSPALGAVDVVNEPDSPADTPSLDSSYNALISNFYRPWINQLRAVDADMPLMFEPYFGSTTISAARLQQLASGRDNLIWSFHDYFSGWGSGDGWSASGWPDGVRTDDWTSGIPCSNGSVNSPSCSGNVVPSSQRWCYPRGNPRVGSGSCDPGPDRATARSQTTAHVDLHRSRADSAGMPLYVGEYNVPHDGPQISTNARQRGWWRGDLFVCDKNRVYRNLNVSAAVWAWEEEIDSTYGMYDDVQNNWHPWTNSIFSTTC